MTSRFSELSRDQLAVLVPELLLIGQLIDRSGMAYCIQHFGREEMLQVLSLIQISEPTRPS